MYGARWSRIYLISADLCVVHVVDTARKEASRVCPERAEQDPGGHQGVE